MNEVAQILIKIAIILFSFSFFTYSFPVLKAMIHYHFLSSLSMIIVNDHFFKNDSHTCYTII